MPASAAAQAATFPEPSSPSRIRTGRAATSVESGQLPKGSYCWIQTARVVGTGIGLQDDEVLLTMAFSVEIVARGRGATRG